MSAKRPPTKKPRRAPATDAKRFAEDTDAPVVKRAVRRKQREAVVDAYVNTVTNVGTSRDKSKQGEYVADAPLDPYTLEVLFMGNDLARKIVSKPVEDALKNGFSIRRKNGDPEKDKPDADRILARYQQIMHHPKDGDRFALGCTWARLHGGGGIILGVKGAGPLSSPLDDAKAKDIELVIDFDRQYLTPRTYYPNGEVRTYTYTSPTGGTAGIQAEVHESRVIVLPGATTTKRMRSYNQLWDLSVLQSIFNVLKSFDDMFASIDSMFADASQAIFKLHGLIESLNEADGEGPQDVSTRFQILDLFRSSLRAIMLDAGDGNGDGAEDFKVVERNIGQLDGVMQQYLIRIAAASNMPLTVLLGTSPAGMDATGEADLIMYFNFVDNYRQLLTKYLTRIINMLARAQTPEGKPPEWEIVWPELQRPKPLDVSTSENMRLTSAISAVTAKIATPEEVALSLDTIAPTLGLKLDTAARKTALTAALKDVETRKNQEPAPAEGPNAGATNGGNAERESERKTPSKAAGKQV